MIDIEAVRLAILATEHPSRRASLRAERRAKAEKALLLRRLRTESENLNGAERDRLNDLAATMEVRP